MMPLHVALFEPQIPPNTGNVARLCAVTGASLHLIEPMGFSLADADVKRAGLDYWDAVDLWVHRDWSAFQEAVAPERCLYFSTHGQQSFWEAPYNEGTVLVFGNEVNGLPQRLREQHADRVYRIPMVDSARCLNLSTAVGIVAYEAIRQVRPLLSSQRRA